VIVIIFAIIVIIIICIIVVVISVSARVQIEDVHCTFTYSPRIFDAGHYSFSNQTEKCGHFGHNILWTQKHPFGRNGNSDRNWN